MSLPFKSSIYLNVQNQQRIKTFFYFLHCTCFHQQSYTEHVQFCHYFLSFMLFQTMFISSFKHKKTIFWRILVTKQMPEATDFHSIFSSYHWSQWLIPTVWLPTISTLVFNRRKKLTQVLRASAWWNCHFLANYPFKAIPCWTYSTDFLKHTTSFITRIGQQV